MGKIPDRWQEYSCIGKVISGTRFIAFKVPLNRNISRNLPPDDQFAVSDLMNSVAEMDLQLGLVIDLTNTTRYYRKEDLESVAVLYKKIFTEGHVVPSLAVCQNFFDAVDNFLTENSNKDSLIGVHCTHGINRTGYLVCRYLIDRMKFTPERAIEEFNKARGHEIERENYLSDLLKLNSSTSQPNGSDSSPGKRRLQESVSPGSRWLSDKYSRRANDWYGGQPGHHDTRIHEVSGRHRADVSDWRHPPNQFQLTYNDGRHNSVNYDRFADHRSNVNPYYNYYNNRVQYTDYHQTPNVPSGTGFRNFSTSEPSYWGSSWNQQNGGNSWRLPVDDAYGQFGRSYNEEEDGWEKVSRRRRSRWRKQN